MDKCFGYIKKACFGNGGYQDSMFGLTLTFESRGTGCQIFKGGWPDKNHDGVIEAVLLLRDTLIEANKKTIDELEGTPVELEFGDDNRLVEWRVLTEVIPK